MPVIKIIPFPGSKGTKGDPGNDGLSAYEIAVDNGFEGTEAEWLASLVSEGATPLPEFLTHDEGRSHLPILNKNFGWNFSGVWFGPTSSGTDGQDSYPIFTNFTIPQNTPSITSFDVEIDNECSDAGVAIYVDGTIPVWEFGTNSTRISAQFDCPIPQLNGIESSVTAEGSVPGPGNYTVVFYYDPNAETEKVKYEVVDSTSQVLFTLTLNEVLPEGDYRIGLAADMDPGEGRRTYIKNLSIVVGEGENTTEYSDTLTSGYSGADSLDLTIPVSITDENGSNLISFEKSYTGTARIVAPQDDLALRSARDIILYPGDDGPGNVYIGWGDAEMTPNSANKVATVGDLGDITFSGVQVIGAGTASGDGNGYGTIEIVPDSGRYSFDQYLVVDPTQPNHIHIRPGGTQDASNAELIIGAEKSNVKVIDSTHQVSVNTYNATSEVSHNWTFGNDGMLYGPSEGSLILTSGIQSGANVNNLTIFSNGGMTLTSATGNMQFYMDGGMYIGDVDSANQIIKRSDLPTGATGSFTSADGKTVTVENGIITSIV